MKEEIEILNKLKGKENPFSVPEGYFDEFTSRFMSELPEQDAKVIHFAKYRRRFALKVISIAAGFLLILGMTGLFFNQSDGHKDNININHTSTSKVVSRDAYIDQATDFAMLDNQDIYECLSDE
jgi:hypothetical protein